MSKSLAHTAVVAAKGKGIYAGINVTLVRSVLPAVGAGEIALRDSLDVLAGTDLTKEVEIATASIRKSAQIAADAAKAAKASKVTLMIKQASTYDAINKIFKEVATEVIESSGLAIDVNTTATVTNQLVMFPETLGVVFTNDVPTCENVELAFAGITGSTLTMHSDAGSVVKELGF